MASCFNKTNFNGNLLVRINDSKFTFIGIGFFNEFYKEDEKTYNETGVQAHIFYSINSDFKIGFGGYANSVFGFQQRLSFNYSKKLGNFFLVVIPTASINKSLKTGEVVIDLSYTKKLNEDWSLFSKVLAMSAFDHFTTHSRSFQQPRIGLGYKKIQFGLFADFDQYGKELTSLENYGLFGRIIF